LITILAVNKVGLLSIDKPGAVPGFVTIHYGLKKHPTQRHEGTKNGKKGMF
jgi:hypothetical protein